MRRQTIKLLPALTAAAVLLIAFLAIYASAYFSQQAVVISLVERWSYLAVGIVGLVAGLNVVVPIPAAALTPLFTAAGLATSGIIVALAIGTLIADFIGFLLGSSTKNLVSGRYPQLTNFLTQLVSTHQNWLIPVVIFYAAFIPFPNEVLLIPLALTGISFTRLLIPLLIGNLLHQFVLVSGVGVIASLL